MTIKKKKIGNIINWMHKVKEEISDLEYKVAGVVGITTEESRGDAARVVAVDGNVNGRKTRILRMKDFPEY